MTLPNSPRAPKHLSPPARRLWAAVYNDYELEEHHAATLVKALEAWDRAEQARQRIDADGLMVVSRLGEAKPHPLLGIERDSRAAFLAGMRALRLDYEVPPTHTQRTAAARVARWRNSP